MNRSYRLLFFLACAALCACGGSNGGGGSGSSGSSGSTGTTADAGQPCSATGCDASSYCDGSTGQCQPGCDSDSQCGANGSCDLQSHQCGCAQGYHDCSGTCAADDSVDSCGQSCSACASHPNANASCDGTGCVYACVNGARSCGTGCSACPTNGVSQTTCAGDSCVAAACLSGYRLCNGTCAACPTNGVADTACQGNRCVAAACSAGYVTCGGSCAACGPADAFCCVETVDSHTGSQGGAGRYASLGVVGDEVAIAYRDDTAKSARVASRGEDAGAWSLETVSGPGDQGEGASAAIGSDGTLYAAWYDANALTYDFGSKAPGGSWTVEPIDVTNSIFQAGRTSLRINAAGHPCVAYDMNTELWYGERDSAGWSVIRVDAAAGTDPSLAFDANDAPHISYSVSAAQQGASFQLLSYAVRTGTTWTTSTVFQRIGTAAETESALVVDSSGQADLLYFDEDFNQLVFAVLPSGSSTWTKTVTVDGAILGGLSLALDGAGGLHASYMDSLAQTVVYSTLVNSQWVPTTVDSALAPEAYTSLAFGASTRPYLTWWDDASSGRLRFAH